MMNYVVVFWSDIVLPTQAKPDGTDGELLRRVTHAYADSDGVKIHFVSVGKGPLIVFVHGFPDFWYTWRHQMEGLSDQFTETLESLGGTVPAAVPHEQEQTTYVSELQTCVEG